MSKILEAELPPYIRWPFRSRWKPLVWDVPIGLSALNMQDLSPGSCNMGLLGPVDKPSLADLYMCIAPMGMGVAAPC